MDTLRLLPVAIGLVAAVYSSVGHAGATGYVAVMTLCGLPTAVVRPTALVLNVLVATIATAQFRRAGHFRPRLFLPLAAASVPCAFLGGLAEMPTAVLEPLLGLVLLASGIRIVVETLGPHGPADTAPDGPSEDGTPPGPLLLATLGGGIGFLSGLTGIGGGVFLTPALLGLKAAPLKSIAAVTAAFILANSLAGLGGGALAGRPVPAASWPILACAAAGGVVGSTLGAFRLPAPALRLLLAVVLAVASARLLLRPPGS